MTGSLWRKYCFPNGLPVPCRQARLAHGSHGSAAAAFTRSLRAVSRRRKPHVHMTKGPHRGSREPPGQPEVDAGARRRGSPHPSRRPTAGREGPGVIMMPGPFSWSTGPLHRATPETATHHVHATGPNKRVSSAPKAFNRTGHCRFTLPTTAFCTPEAGNSANTAEHRERIRTRGRVYLDPAKPPKAHQSVSHGCTLPALERCGAMYFRMAKSRRSVRTTQHWRTVIANSKP
jgi:hypothetical protein